jgi:hypothetical protein
LLEHLDLLLSTAKQAHGEQITPCCGKPWTESLSERKNHVMLWYNKPCGSTAMIAYNKETKQIEDFSKKGDK